MARLYALPTLFLAVLLASGCSSGTTDGQTNTSASNSASGESLPTLGQEVRHGAAVVKVEWVRVGKATIKHNKTEKMQEADERTIQFAVTIHNSSDDVILVMNGWGKDNWLKGYRGLLDAKGNRYRLRTTNSGVHIVGATDADNRIKPGQTSTDTFAFEEPLPAAKDLLLTIDIPKHGDHPAGEITFRIPEKAWKK